MHSLTHCEKLVLGILADSLDPDGKLPPPSLVEFVTAMLPPHIELHEWQLDLLEVLADTFYLDDVKHLRTGIHAPPRAGKSWLVSALVIAWLLGVNPDWRVGLACYNLTHARGFVKQIGNIMCDARYIAMFPAPECRLVLSPSGEFSESGFSTNARVRSMDSQQHSVTALSIDTGYTGKGFEWLVIDDPYASETDAFSDAVNGRAHRFLNDVMERAISGVTPDGELRRTRIILMFHRYHSRDIAALAFKEHGFREVRFPAIADGDPNDPTGRAVGEPLSPMIDVDGFYRLMERDPHRALALHQGKPSETLSKSIPVELFTLVQGAAPRIGQVIRGWDIGLTGIGDATASALIGFTPDAMLNIMEVVEHQVDIASSMSIILQTALRDPPGTVIAIEDSAVTKKLKQDIQRDPAFARFQIVWIKPGTRHKWTRISRWVERLRSHGILLYDRAVEPYRAGLLRPATTQPGWVAQFIDRCRDYNPSLAVNVDDGLDAVAIAYEAAEGHIPQLLDAEMPLEPFSANSPLAEWQADGDL